MGLFVNSNPDLERIIDYSLMTGTRYIDYFDYIIKNYTSNLFSVDANYYYHVANIEKLRKNSVDEYSMNWVDGKQMSKQPLNFKSRIKSNAFDGTEDEEKYKIPIDFYTINSNFSEIYKETYNKYSLGLGGKPIKDEKDLLETNEKIGLGSNSTNTFGPFKSHKFPYYQDRINKMIGGNSIRLFTNNVIFELIPFNIINIELFLPYKTGSKERLDEEHSGKKIVIGFTIDYIKPFGKNKNFNTLTQTIDVI